MVYEECTHLDDGSRLGLDFGEKRFGSLSYLMLGRSKILAHTACTHLDVGSREGCNDGLLEGSRDGLKRRVIIHRNL